MKKCLLHLLWARLKKWELISTSVPVFGSLIRAVMQHPCCNSSYLWLFESDFDDLLLIEPFDLLAFDEEFPLLEDSFSLP
jgi:hypothetical protein